MTLEQFESLKNTNFENNDDFSKFVIEELKKLDEKHQAIYEQEYLPLLYGYTLDRDSFSVNIEFNKIVVFDGKKNILPKSFQECLPNKRAYPNETSYFFTKLCNQFGYGIDFTSY